MLPIQEEREPYKAELIFLDCDNITKDTLVHWGDYVYKIRTEPNLNRIVMNLELERLLDNWKQQGDVRIITFIKDSCVPAEDYAFLKAKVRQKDFFVGEKFLPTGTTIRDITPTDTGQILEETPIVYEPISLPSIEIQRGIISRTPIPIDVIPKGTMQEGSNGRIIPSRSWWGGSGERFGFGFPGDFNWLLIAGLIIGGVLLFMFLNKKKKEEK